MLFSCGVKTTNIFVPIIVSSKVHLCFYSTVPSKNKNSTTTPSKNKNSRTLPKNIPESSGNTLSFDNTQMLFKNISESVGNAFNFDTTETDAPTAPTKTQYNSDVFSNTGELLLAISDLEREFGIKLRSFPNIIVLGPQSSGKTSLIEGLCGDSILPKNMDMSTMKPFNITTIRSEERKFKIRGETIHSTSEAEQILDRLNNNPSVATIDIELYGPDKRTARFTDLPGLYYVDKANPSRPKDFRDINEQYLKEKNNIPVVVSSAASDSATNQAIEMVQSFGRDDESLGVLTKIDLTKHQSTTKVQKMLAGALPDYEMGRGWIATVLRNKRDVDAGITVSEKEEMEKEFFKKNPQFSPSGLDTIRQAISKIQYEGIKHNLPRILKDVEDRIQDLKQSTTFLSKMLTDPKNRLAGRLQGLIEKLVGTSLDRAEFEELLRKDLQHTINKHIFVALEHANTNKERECYIEEKHRLSSSLFDLHHSEKSSPEFYRNDHFADLFRYGLVSPLVADNESIQHACRTECMLGSSMPIVKFYKNDPLGKERAQWNRSLGRFFDSLLKDDKIQGIVYDITISRVLQYIKSDSDLEADDLAHKFAEYIVREIGSKAYEENIQFSIKSMIMTEKRPNISQSELTRHIAQMHPEKFTFKGTFFELFSTRECLHVEVYGSTFNEAYIKAVASRLSDNIYRNIAVNLLDNMVRKLLEMTIELFNKDTVEKETIRVNEKLEKLRMTETILRRFTNLDVKTASRKD